MHHRTGIQLTRGLEGPRADDLAAGVEAALLRSLRSLRRAASSTTKVTILYRIRKIQGRLAGGSLRLFVCRSWPSAHWHGATAAKGKRPRASLPHTRKGYVLPEGHLAVGEETLASLGHGYYIYGLPGEGMPEQTDVVGQAECGIVILSSSGYAGGWQIGVGFLSPTLPSLFLDEHYRPPSQVGKAMLAIIEHRSGLTFSIKTFRPLWLFPWHSSIWRQFPFRTCIATIRYDDKEAAHTGHKELTSLLQELEIGPRMAEPFQAIEGFGKAKTNAGVKSYRIYPGHVVEGKVVIKVTPERSD